MSLIPGVDMDIFLQPYQKYYLGQTGKEKHNVSEKKSL